jgi:hypothetical protein
MKEEEEEVNPSLSHVYSFVERPTALLKMNKTHFVNHVLYP